MPGPSRRPLDAQAEHGPTIYLSVERTPIMRLARTLDNRSWRPGFYSAIFRANKLIAERVQEVAAGILEESILRESQSTGRLYEAVTNPRAVYADAQRIVIGVGEYLDEQASYWRPVEFGAPGLMGRVAFGFWTRAPRSATGRVALEGPLRGERSGRPIIASWDEPPEIVATNLRPGARPYFEWRIEHPTQAKHYFLTAYMRVGQSGFMEATYRNELRQVIGPNGKPIILGREFRAYHGRPVTASDFRI